MSVTSDRNRNSSKSEHEVSRHTLRLVRVLFLSSLMLIILPCTSVSAEWIDVVEVSSLEWLSFDNETLVPTEPNMG